MEEVKSARTNEKKSAASSSTHRFFSFGFFSSFRRYSMVQFRSNDRATAASLKKVPRIRGIESRIECMQRAGVAIADLVILLSFRRSTSSLVRSPPTSTHLPLLWRRRVGFYGRGERSPRCEGRRGRREHLAGAAPRLPRCVGEEGAHRWFFTCCFF